MLKIALTGGVASGKSSVANVFKNLGATIIDADVIAHQITKNPEILQTITSHFGAEILQTDGYLNRRKLRGIIFSDDNERYWLENLLHPSIINEMKTQIKKIEHDYCILVIPLLTEKSSLIDFIDRVCVVDVAESVQIARIIQRDQIDQATAVAMLRAQASRVERNNIADDIIDNSEDQETLQHTVELLDKKYIALAKKGDHHA